MDGPFDEKDDIILKKKYEDYQIVICRDGKFVVTFDTELDGTVEIDETIAYFKINNDFTIEKNYKLPSFEGPELDINNSMADENKVDRWSIDISNIHKKNDDGYFILVALSRIKVDEDMKNNDNNYDYKERYSKKKKFEFSLKAMLRRVGVCYSNNLSGICRFVEVSNFSDHYYSFRLSEKFEYPQSIKRKLNNWYTDTDDGCMKRLLSSIYDKYFLVTKYKKDSQLLEVYNLVNMELETTAKRFEKENELFNFNYTIFTISSLQLCFTQGNNIIKLYCMENGLQVASKKFNEIERIHLLEFIDSDETLLVIGESPKEDKDPEEPWVLGEHERKKLYPLLRTEEEILQLFVGGSTVQIWHQIKDDGKNKGDLPNNGNPFLEYIWSNRIPINQERDKTKLRIEYFKCGSNDRSHEKLNDFHLKIDENKDINEKRKQKFKMVMKRCDKVIKRENISEKFRAIRHVYKALEHLNKRYKNKSLIDNYIKSYKYRDMITYIELIVWKFAKLEPQNFRLLDIRHNIMKSLILSDCDDLIKYVLFGNEEFIGNKVVHDEPRHILHYGLKETIKPENNMELAIYHCKDDYVIKLFYKECFAGITQDSVGLFRKNT
ncbi:hypothetical protein RhiirA5_429665 [Rhizophagus irregularis]|uniref:Uncharacterized protein n=1 Tax=Rhizophagus irregularis TaxID=588596 RepID=A0A2N0NY00_9GLOM|nr:hypothetical protein RhiirA5_429665 [Rhizophagus irregularis]